uniref:Serine protease n=1 Tax=Peronospora matthiolae TaxID=2874970 RepID=A0AAV1TP37_9STRA
MVSVWVLVLSLLSLPVRVLVNRSLCRRQLGDVPNNLQNADAVVVLHPVAHDRWSLFRSKEQSSQTLYIVQPGAAFIAVNLKDINLLWGDKIIVRDPNNDSSITITTTNASLLAENLESNKLPQTLLLRTHPLLIEGNAVVVEYVPSIPMLILPMVESQRDVPVIVLDSYAYVMYNRKAGRAIVDVDAESTVGVTDESEEAVCYRKTEPKMYEKARAVARLMIRSEYGQASDASEQVSSWMFCTGWLVGEGNYLLTNHHCMEGAAVVNRDRSRARSRGKRIADSDESLSDAATRLWRNVTSRTDKTKRVMETIVGFMAETRCCHDPGFKGEKVGVVEATRVLVVAENPELDYALVRVLTNDSSTDLSQRYGYLRLRSTGPVDGEDIYIPQHPHGEPKEIAAVKDGQPAEIEVVPTSSVDYPAYYRQSSESNDVQPTVWYNADTKPGSSGSPVLSREDDTVVALHRAGGIDAAQTRPTEILNSGVRTDLIARDLKRRRVLPKNALAP